MLKTRIYTFEKALAFQVLEQEPKVQTYLSSIGGSYIASNGWTITIAKMPELNADKKIIALRSGNWEHNLRIDRTWGLASNYQRDSIINEAEAALSEFKWAVTYNPGAVNFVIIPAKVASKPIEAGNGENNATKPCING